MLDLENDPFYKKMLPNYEWLYHKYRVLQYSRGFKEKLTKLKEKGYLPHSAIVRFIVAWKNKNYDEELPIVLADISFRKTQQHENTL